MYLAGRSLPAGVDTFRNEAGSIRAYSTQQKANTGVICLICISNILERKLLSTDIEQTQLSLTKTPSQLESMVQEAKLLRKIVEEESDVCELDEKWHGIYDIISDR
jgi:hypothetical protein